ncbi:HET-domain-containing protein [Whalleya microplaca]|nr:HET-domain-containing protein [Whalleya microplaca]
MLCKVCKDGLEEPYPEDFLYTFGHHRNEVSFTRSAQQGCVMCCDFPFIDGENGYANKVRMFGFFTIFWLSCEHTNPAMTVDSGRGSKTVTLVPVRDDLTSEYALNFYLSPSTNSMQTWSMIDNWIANCMKYHERCRRKGWNYGYRPTRLLQMDYSKNPHTFRVVSGQMLPQDSRYITLSYCWGKKPVNKTLRLLESTSAWLSKSHPVDFLPKTLREATYIASRFRNRYMWIDRLCIYQDSPKDWRKQASTMQDVYGNAVFNISALGAEDDEGGCFFSRDPSLFAPTAIRIYGWKDTLRADLEDTEYPATFRDEPLIKRGWNLQERLLSPRIIHFGSREVFWECTETHACETRPNGFKKTSPEISPSRETRLWKQLINTPKIPCIGDDQVKQILADWSATVNLFSGTELTMPNDKLVAISGLAKDAYRELRRSIPRNPRYLAGIWENVLMATLTWYVRIDSPAKRPPSYRAPSWSWASLDGRVIMPDTFGKENLKLASLISADIVYIGTDDTGEVKSATLTLIGPTCLVETRVLSRRRYAAKAFRQPLNCIIECNGAECGWLPEPIVIFDTMDDIRHEPFCLWIIAHPGSLGGWQASGLVLRCVGYNTFQRVGTISCYYPSRSGLVEFIDAITRRLIKII